MRSVFIFLLLNAFSAFAQNPQEVFCQYINLVFNSKIYYSCSITNTTITTASIPLQFYGNHLDGNTNENVTNIITSLSSNIIMDIFHP
ncbi:hypothetical protein PVAND_007670 [Polypedilum vanderplanki]|uniref:Uncharacterized protein n=1 Tax=Polypedilum vanderplanki TaxID=319348 RepID=A0A9J6C7N4_POLVA|nr:hypothetical protein PVAND_007670 [Polypedilum vanderplanki]